jgi:hypothetical protein
MDERDDLIGVRNNGDDLGTPSSILAAMLTHPDKYDDKDLVEDD